MAVMMGSLYAALREANVPEDKAQKAAEEAAGFENKLAALQSEVSVIKWMLGTNVALTLAVLAILLRMGGLR